MAGTFHDLHRALIEEELTRTIRVVVVGDEGSGKTSLIETTERGGFIAEPQRVYDVVTLSSLTGSSYPKSQVEIIDTESQCDWCAMELSEPTKSDLLKADAVVLTYASPKDAMFLRVKFFWLPYLATFKPQTPVILVGCMADLLDISNIQAEMMKLKFLLREFRNVDACMLCSSKKSHQDCLKVFLAAQRASFHPLAPLLSPNAQTLSYRLLNALERIFCLHGASAAMYTKAAHIKFKCSPPFHVFLRHLLDTHPEGFHPRNFKLRGFLLLHHLYIKRDLREVTWEVLKRYGYNDKILRDQNSLPSLRTNSHQSFELTDVAKNYLKEFLCKAHSSEIFGAGLMEYVESFPGVKGSAKEAGYKDQVELTEKGRFSVDGFFAMWALMALRDPANTLVNLVDIGYMGTLDKALRRTSSRLLLDNKEQQSDKNVFQCFVFGPKNAGKSSLLDLSLGRPVGNSCTNPSTERFAAKVVCGEFGKKTLVLPEIPEEGVKTLLSKKNSLALCDVAIFVHDSSEGSSWEKAKLLVWDVASHAASGGFKVPCFIVATKCHDPRDPADDEKRKFLRNIDYRLMRHWPGILLKACMGVDFREKKYTNIFLWILYAAEFPHERMTSYVERRSEKLKHAVAGPDGIMKLLMCRDRSRPICCKTCSLPP